MKKLVAVLLVLCLGAFPAAAETAASAGAEGAARRIEQRTYPLYLGRLENTWPEEFPLYFVDGVNDLPYMDLNDFAALLNWFFPAKDPARWKDYRVTVETDEAAGRAALLRENGSALTFDFALGRMSWDDYSAFREGADGFSIDLLRGFRAQDAKGRPCLLSMVRARESPGGPVTLDLKERGIPMAARDGLYLMPMQTLSAFCLSTESVSLYFNHRCLILCNPRQMTPPYGKFLSFLADDWGDLGAKLVTGTDILPGPSLLKTYMAGPKGGRSQGLADYGYRELCLELDMLYGLRETLGADSFTDICAQTGLTADLLSRNPATADGALKHLMETRLDDGHSVCYNGSYRASASQNDAVPGPAAKSRFDLYEQLVKLRAQYPGASKGYYETDGTAFIVLDSFTYDSGIDYYEAAKNNALPDDAIGRIIRAHRWITRENSPVRSVVLDLSCNVGGAVPAAIYTIAWFLGDAGLSMRDTFGGAEAAARFLADVNLDRRFDARDTLSGRNLNLYCLTSPVSYSCGNLAAWAFKADGRVKLLGGVTSGGSCAVWPMTTAWGASYSISGPYRLSFLKSRAFIEGERGAAPDAALPSYNAYYDRQALAEFIGGLR